MSSNRDERPDQSAAGHANVGQRDSGGPDAPGQADGSQEQLAEKDAAIGTVYLVGAGPGSPDLLTLAGMRALQRADVVLYDGLIDPRLLHQAPQAAHVCVGKHGKTPIWTQEDINRRLIEEAQSGRTVVRLKGGDPAVFGRTAEELEALVSAGIPFRVVPGVTAGLAAASYCGIPITHRDHASAVALVTGHQSDSNARHNPLDWHALARFPGTLVVYMGVTTAGEWSKHLIAAGKPTTTPVAIVRRCTWPDQKTIRCTLGQVGEVLAPHRRLRPPAVIIVGEVAGEDQRWDWFDRLPLRGVGVLITRPEPQARELAAPLEDLGAAVWIQPAIRIDLPEDQSGLGRAMAILARAAGLEPNPQGASAALDPSEPWGLTFSSPNSVAVFWRYVLQHGYDARLAAGCKIAVVGPGTADALGEFGLRADFMPDAGQGYSASGLLQHLQSLRPPVRRWLVTASNESRDTLVQGLQAAGWEAERVETYRAVANDQLAPDVAAALEAGQIQFCTVTSAAIARASFAMLQGHIDRVRPISFSPAVSEQLRALGWPPVEEAGQQTIPELIASIVRAVVD